MGWKKISKQNKIKIKIKEKKQDNKKDWRKNYPETKQTSSLGRLQKKSLEYDNCLLCSIFITRESQETPTNNIASPQS